MVVLYFLFCLVIRFFFFFFLQYAVVYHISVLYWTNDRDERIPMVDDNLRNGKLKLLIFAHLINCDGFLIISGVRFTIYIFPIYHINHAV